MPIFTYSIRYSSFVAHIRFFFNKLLLLITLFGLLHFSGAICHAVQVFLGALLHFIAQLVQKHLVPLLLVALLIGFGFFFFVGRRVMLNFPPVFFDLVAGHDWDVGEQSLDLGVPVLVLLIGFGELLRLLHPALKDLFSLLALLEVLRQLALIALVEGLLNPNLLHRLWNLPQSVMRFPWPKGLENHGFARATLVSSFFLITAGFILVVVVEAVVALGHDTYPNICIFVARHVLIEFTLVEIYEAVRPEQTFLLVFLSLLVPLLDGFLFQPALIVRFVLD